MWIGRNVCSGSGEDAYICINDIERAMSSFTDLFSFSPSPSSQGA